jgi:protein tyrosine phosphatase type IVA
VSLLLHHHVKRVK